MKATNCSLKSLININYYNLFDHYSISEETLNLRKFIVLRFKASMNDCTKAYLVCRLYTYTRLY